MAEKKLSERMAVAETKLENFGVVLEEIKDALKSIDIGLKDWFAKDENRREQMTKQVIAERTACRAAQELRFKELWFFFLLARHPYLACIMAAFLLTVIEYIPEIRDLFLPHL